MTNKEILNKALNKVREKGFKKYHSDFSKDWDNLDIRGVMFDPDFCKAFWGKEIVCEVCGEEGCFDSTPKEKKIGIPYYVYNLIIMVQCGAKGAEDPIGVHIPKTPLQYIKNFL